MTGEIEIEDGEPVGGIGVVQDVTERKRLERRLQRERERLLQTEELADIGGWEYDPAAECLSWTPGMRRLHEVGEGFEPTLERVIEFYHPEDRERLRTALASCRQDGTPFDFEVRMTTTAGRERKVRVTGERVEEGGGTTLLRGAVRDVTTARERRQRLAVLSRVLRHNIRNELNVVLGHATELEERVADGPTGDGRADATALEHVERIEASARKLYSLAERAREFEQTLQRDDVGERTALRPLLEELQATYRDRYPDATITLTGPEVTVPAARDALRVSIDPLVENAVEHSDRASPTVTIRLSHMEDDRVTLAIADDGPGIPEMEREALADGRETPLSHGRGLGLWTVNWLVSRLGGSVDIRENEPRGTVVELTLPALETA